MLFTRIKLNFTMCNTIRLREEKDMCVHICIHIWICIYTCVCCGCAHIVTGDKGIMKHNHCSLKVSDHLLLLEAI